MKRQVKREVYVDPTAEPDATRSPLEAVTARVDQAVQVIDTVQSTIDGAADTLEKLWHCLQVYIPRAAEAVASAAVVVLDIAQPAAIVVPGLQAALAVVRALILTLRQVKCNNNKLADLAGRCCIILNIIRQYACNLASDTHRALVKRFEDTLMAVDEYAKRYRDAGYLAKALFAWTDNSDLESLRKQLKDMQRDFDTAAAVATQAGVETLVETQHDNEDLEKSLRLWMQEHGGMATVAKAMKHPLHGPKLIEELQDLTDIKPGAVLDMEVLLLTILSEIYQDPTGPDSRGPHRHIKHLHLRRWWFDMAQSPTDHVNWSVWWNYWYPTGADASVQQELADIAAAPERRRAIQDNMEKDDPDTTLNVYEVDHAFPDTCNVVERFRALTVPNVVPLWPVQTHIRMQQTASTISQLAAAEIVRSCSAPSDPSQLGGGSSLLTAQVVGVPGSGVHTTAGQVAQLSQSQLGVMTISLELPDTAPHKFFTDHFNRPSSSSTPGDEASSRTAVQDPDDSTVAELRSISDQALTRLSESPGDTWRIPKAVAEAEEARPWSLLLVISNAQAMQADHACQRLLGRIQAELPSVRTLLLTTVVLDLRTLGKACKTLHMQPWHLDDARQLVYNCCPELTEAECLQIMEVCQGSPLLLRIVADRVQSGVMSPQLWQELRQLTQEKSSSIDCTSVLRVLLRGLPDEQRSALSALSNFASTFSLHDAAQVASRTEAYMSGMLKILQAHGLVYCNTTADAWTMHPSVRKAAVPPPNVVISKFVSHMVSTAAWQGEAYASSRSLLLLRKCREQMPNLQAALDMLRASSSILAGMAFFLRAPAGTTADLEHSSLHWGSAAEDETLAVSKLEAAAPLMAALGLQQQAQAVVDSLRALQGSSSLDADHGEDGDEGCSTVKEPETAGPLINRRQQAQLVAGRRRARPRRRMPLRDASDDEGGHVNRRKVKQPEAAGPPLAALALQQQARAVNDALHATRGTTSVYASNDEDDSNGLSNMDNSDPVQATAIGASVDQHNDKAMLETLHMLEKVQYRMQAHKVTEASTEAPATVAARSAAQPSAVIAPATDLMGVVMGFDSSPPYFNDAAGSTA